MHGFLQDNKNVSMPRKNAFGYFIMYVLAKPGFLVAGKGISRSDRYIKIRILYVSVPDSCQE